MLKKLVEILEVVKRMESDHPRGSTYHLKTMATMDEVLMLEDKLELEEERQALVKYHIYHLSTCGPIVLHC